MKQLKILWILLLSSLLIFNINVVPALSNWQPWLVNPLNPEKENPTVAEEEIDWQAILPWIDKESKKLEWILKLDKPENYETSLDYTMALIQIIINWVLWILAFVALVYLLYCWILILTSGSDEKNSSKWKKWISTAAIALAWIGLSWLIISAIIRFIGSMTKSWVS